MIDLGQISVDDLDEDRIRQTILTQLARRLKGLPPGDVEVLPADDSFERALFGLLERGYWPWDSPYRRVEELEHELRTMRPVTRDGVIERLRPLLGHRTIRLRVVHQFSSSFVEWLVQQLQPKKADDMFAVAESIFHRLGKTESKEVLLAVAALGGLGIGREYQDQNIEANSHTGAISCAAHGTLLSKEKRGQIGRAVLPAGASATGCDGPAR